MKQGIENAAQDRLAVVEPPEVACAAPERVVAPPGWVRPLGGLPPTTTRTGSRTGVYFVRAAGYVKIGLARCVVSRVAGLKSASPVPLNPVGFIPTPLSYRDAFKLEAELHQRFVALRRHGEWFVEEAELTSFMEAHLVAWPVSDAR